MNTCEITIAIPIYNAEEYIRPTLESALNQSFEDIEFLMVDDCGIDSTMDIVYEYQQQHPRGKDIRIVCQPQNLGIGNARNRILDEARGRYLYFLDADDTIESNTIALMWQAAQVNNAQVVLASYARNGVEYQLPFKVFCQENELAEYAFHKYNALQAAVWNVLIDLDFIRACGLRFVDTNFWEDFVFKHELVTYVSRAVLLPDITYYYRCHENSLSNYQGKKEIPKSEIFRNVTTIETLKQNYDRLIGKPYFANWLNFVLKTDFYIICNVLKKRKLIQPSINSKELQNFLYSPLSVAETWKHGNVQTFIYKVLSILPPMLMVTAIKVFGKLKGLV